MATACCYSLWWCLSDRRLLVASNAPASSIPTGLGSGDWLQSERCPLLFAPGCPWLCIHLDLDHLKWTNDTRGHGAGDQYICTAAQVLSQAVRRGVDEAFRSGTWPAMSLSDPLSDPLRSQAAVPSRCSRGCPSAASAPPSASHHRAGSSPLAPSGRLAGKPPAGIRRRRLASARRGRSGRADAGPWREPETTDHWDLPRQSPPSCPVGGYHLPRVRSLMSQCQVPLPLATHSRQRPAAPPSPSSAPQEQVPCCGRRGLRPSPESRAAPFATATCA